MRLLRIVSHLTSYATPVRYAAVCLLVVVASALVVVFPLGLVAVGVGVAHLAVALLYPVWMLASISVAISFESMGHLGITLGGIPITLAKLVMLSAIPLWAIRAQQTHQPLVIPTPITLGFGLILLSMVISIWPAGNLIRPLMAMVTFAMLAVLVHLVVAVSQQVEVVPMFQVIGLLAVASLAGSAWLGARGEGGRLLGWGGNPNVWATAVVVWVPPLIASFAPAKNGLFRGVAALLAGLAVVNVGLTASRGGLLALLVTVPFLVVAFRKQRAFLMLAGLGLVIFSFYFIYEQMIIDRLAILMASGERDIDASYAYRLEAVNVALGLFREHPLVGVGVGMYGSYHAVETATGFYGDAHNMYLTIAAEQGVVGLAALAVFMGALVRALVQVMQSAWGTDREPLVFGLVGSLAAWLVTGLSGWSFYEVQAYFYMGIILGIAYKQATQQGGAPCPD